MSIKITVDFEDGVYRLMANDGIMEPLPAGPRLYRGGDFPAVHFVHENAESAAIDAEKLSAYLAERAGHKKSRR